MDAFNHSPPAKRPFPNSTDYTLNGFKHSRKLHLPPLSVPTGHVGFRILCKVSFISAFIGKSGLAIKQLQQDTVSKIRVEDAPPDCDDRVIVVVASTALKNTITLKNPTSSGHENNADPGNALEISDAQLALVRVFDRILDVAMVSQGVSAPHRGVVSCRLLVESRQVGSVIGKGGKIIDKIRMECCCKIGIIKEEKLPACLGQSNEVIEIEGDITAVRKTLLAVSQCLQDCPTADMSKLIGSRSLEPISQETLPDFPVGLPKQNFSVQGKPNSSFNFASRDCLSSLESDRIPVLDSGTMQKEVVFKILCPNDKVGGVIGKGGAIVAGFHKETGASISIGPLVSKCDERLITITSLQDTESCTWPAQNALCLVFARSIDVGLVKGLEPQLNKALKVSARLVAPSNKVGCLIGKGGAIIALMRKETGARIMISGSEQVPKCVSENDVVIQISGEFVNVQDAICHITSRLQDRDFSTAASNIAAGHRNSSSAIITDARKYGRAGDDESYSAHTSYSVPQTLNRHPSLTASVDAYGSSHKLDHSIQSQIFNELYSMGAPDVSRGLTSLKGVQELGSGSRSAVVTNTSVEIVVPRDLIGSIYGENGDNLNRMRKISGAKVVVTGRGDDAVVSISGSPDQTQAAQSLLQAFILIR